MHKLLNNPGKHSRLPPFKAQQKQTFEGENELFDPHPFAWRTWAPGSLRTKEVNLCCRFSCLKSIIFAVFVKTPSFWQGTTQHKKNGFCEPNTRIYTMHLEINMNIVVHMSLFGSSVKSNFCNVVWVPRRASLSEKALHVYAM